MISIATAIENSQPIFILAYIFAIAATSWSLGYWLTCDFLRSKNPKTWPKTERKRSTLKNLYIYRSWQFVISVCIIILFILTCFCIAWVSEQKELSSLHGWVYPGNGETPINACGDLSNGQMIVLLGKVAVLVDSFPKSVLAINGQKVINIDKKQDGSMAISMDIFDDAGHIITRIDNGKFDVVNNILTMERTNRHSLRVVSNKGEEVISMKFINPSTMRLNLILNYPNHGKLIIDESGVSFRNSSFLIPSQQGICIKGDFDVIIP